MQESKEMSSVSVTDKPQGEAKSRLSNEAKIGIVVGAVVGVIALIVIIYLLLKYPGTTQTIRDLFIIVLALETFVIGTLLLILVWQIITLVRLIREELKPMINSTQETLENVKGTTTFISDRVTQPAIKAMSYTSGMTRAMGVLFDLATRQRARPTPKKE